jgi:two-component system sensor histidine kinase KdpD
LAVARGLVEAHGGRISARNREQKGASFSFTLPVKPALPPLEGDEE